MSSIDRLKELQEVEDRLVNRLKDAIVPMFQTRPDTPKAVEPTIEELKAKIAEFTKAKTVEPVPEHKVLEPKAVEPKKPKIDLSSTKYKGLFN